MPTVKLDAAHGTRAAAPESTVARRAMPRWRSLPGAYLSRRTRGTAVGRIALGATRELRARQTNAQRPTIALTVHEFGSLLGHLTLYLDELPAILAALAPLAVNAPAPPPPSAAAGPDEDE